MRIYKATQNDAKYIADRDVHLLAELVERKIENEEIYIICNESNQSIGWMRYGYFWDNTPFMNLIWVDEAYRAKGYGKQVLHVWEEEMKSKGFKLVMTSTLSNEDAQHFFRRMGYKDSGCLLLDHEPLEILMTKSIL